MKKFQLVHRSVRDEFYNDPEKDVLVFKSLAGYDPELDYGGKELPLTYSNNELDLSVDSKTRQVLEALEDEEFLDEDDSYFEKLNMEEIDYDYDDELSDDGFESNNWIDKFRRLQDQQSSSDTASVGSCQDTNLSLTSSSVFRNEKLTLLDDRFDKVLEEYSETEIGELDNTGTEGVVELDEKMDKIFDDFLEETHLNNRGTRLCESKESRWDSVRMRLKDTVPDIEKHSILRPYVEPKQLEIPEKEDLWDIESVQSTYTDIYNRPAVIREISKNAPRIRIKENHQPKIIIPQERVLKQSTTICRPSDETPQQKKERKQQVKMDKKVKREMKKEQAQAFKKEKMVQVKQAPNNKLQRSQVIIN